MSTYVAAKTIAADVRKAIRKATKTPGDPLFGLTVSVTSPQASMCSEVAVTVKGLDRSLLMRPDGPDRERHGWATDYARDLSDRLHELAEPATRWADGRMHFCFVTFDGLSAPRPRAWDRT